MYTFGDFNNELDDISLNIDNNDVFSKKIPIIKTALVSKKVPEVKKMFKTEMISFDHFGISNVENCCYINASLQALFNCKCFVDSLNKYATRRSGSSDTIDILIEFQSKIKMSNVEKFDTQTDSITPVNSVAVVSPCLQLVNLLGFTSNQLEDAEEFLTKLITTIHEDLLKCKFDNKENHSMVNNSEENGWLEIGKSGKAMSQAREDGGDMSNDTLMTEWLSGKTIEVEYIGKGGNKKGKNKRYSTNAPFFILPLNMHADNITDVEQAMINLTDPEKLTPNLTRQTLINKLPKEHLIIQLKRFGYSAERGVEKLFKHIELNTTLKIPKSCLHMDTILSNSNTDYQLDAIIFHLGNHANSGHYTAAIRQKNATDWIYIDDSCLYHIPNIENSKSLNWLLKSTVNKPPRHLLSLDISNSNSSVYNDKTCDANRVPYLLFYSKL